MASADSGVKFFRSFRIPIEESDDFIFTVKKIDAYELVDVLEATPVNISFTGLAFRAQEELAENQKVSLYFKFKKLEINIEGKIVRISHAGERPIYGVEFKNDSQVFGKTFLKEFINSFPSARLKKELKNSLLEVSNKALEINQNDAELIINLAKMLSRFDHLEEFVEYLCHELKRVVNCEQVAFYFSKEEGQLERKYSSNSELFPLNKEYDISKSIVRVTMTQNKIFNGVVLDDTFWQGRTQKNKLTSVLIAPMFDHYGKIVGCIEFFMKKQARRFDDKDEALARFMCYLLTFLLEELKSRAPENKRIAPRKKFKKRKYALIGRSEEIANLRAKIIEHKERPGHLLITGEVGSGKMLFSDIIRTEGVLDKFQVCSLNLRNPQEYKLFQSYLDEINKFQNKLFKVKHFEVISKPDFEKLEKILNSDISKGHKIIFHLFFTPPMEHKMDLKMLKKFVVDIPPLRKRKYDFFHIFSYFLDQECEQRGLPNKKLSKKVVDELTNNEWPGNVEELLRVVGRIVDVYPYHHFIYELPENDVFPIIKEKLDPLSYNKILIRDLLQFYKKEEVQQLLLSKFVVDRYHLFHNDKEQTAQSLGIDIKEVDGHINRFTEMWCRIA